MKTARVFVVLALTLAAIPVSRAFALNPDAVKETAAGAVKSVKTEAQTAAKAALIDLNSATKEQLMSLKGIGEAYAAKIIAGRPFKMKSELVSKNILPEGVYKRISDLIIAKQK